MKVNIKDRVMKCYMCGKWTRLNDTGLCDDCLSQKEKFKTDSYIIADTLGDLETAPDAPELASNNKEV